MHDIRNIRRVPLPIIVASSSIQSGFGLALDCSDVEVPNEEAPRQSQGLIDDDHLVSRRRHAHETLWRTTKTPMAAFQELRIRQGCRSAWQGWESCFDLLAM